MFSSIGYAPTVTALVEALSCMARHLDPDGVLIVEPWFTPEEWIIDQPALTTTSLEHLTG